MSGFVQKPGNFSVFKNSRKEKQTHPDFTGDANIDGTFYWVNMWEKTDKNGNTYFSGTYKPKDQAFAAAKQSVEAQAPLGQKDDIEDSIPF